ncbi:MAG: ComEA family DNA-binding protein [Candidatus Levybacteria bacterium]|nr:ComEA family DNA-binding protein [Candidatus Levybacteria bacterium]
MNFHSLGELFLPLAKEHKIAIIIGSIGLMFFVYGLIAFLGTAQKDEEITFEAGEENRVATGSAVKIIVDVSGSVVSPGVYTLSENARMQDALIAAGGLANDANREWVAKNINLAVKLSDGAKVYVPSINDQQNVSVAAQGSQESVLGTQYDSLININTASATTLDTLPGVGPATSQKIIDNRPYASVDELVSKKAVNKATFEKIKDKVTIY